MSITTASSIRRRRHEQNRNTEGAEVFNANGLAPAAAGADVLTDHTQSPAVVGERPPLTGRGSGKESWTAFATSNGYAESDLDGLTRDQIAALEYPKPGEPDRGDDGGVVDVTQTEVESSSELEADTEGERVGDYADTPGVDSEESLVEVEAAPADGEDGPAGSVVVDGVEYEGEIPASAAVEPAREND